MRWIVPQALVLLAGCSTGNFLAFIGNPSSRALTKRTTVAFRQHATLASDDHSG